MSDTRLTAYLASIRHHLGLDDCPATQEKRPGAQAAYDYVVEVIAAKDAEIAEARKDAEIERRKRLGAGIHESSKHGEAFLRDQLAERDFRIDTLWELLAEALLAEPPLSLAAQDRDAVKRWLDRRLALRARVEEARR